MCNSSCDSSFLNTQGREIGNLRRLIARANEGNQLRFGERKGAGPAREGAGVSKQT